MPWWALALRITGIGWYITTSIVGGTLAGVWIDARLGTKPLFMLIGLLLGMVVAFYGTYKALQPLLNQPERPSKPPNQKGE